MKRFFGTVLLLFSTLAFSEAKLKIYLFASSTCEQCRYLKELVLPDILEMNPQVEMEHVKVDDEAGFALMLKMEDIYTAEGQAPVNVATRYRFIGSKDASVKAFVGTVCLAGAELIEEKLEDVVKAELKAGRQTTSPFATVSKAGNTADSERLERKFDSLQWGTVAGAGFLDGINPCAFVTLVFFISVLANLRKSRRDIIVVGLLFALAVFVTYFLLGLGALTVVKEFSVKSGMAKGLNIFMALFCLVIGLISLTDAMRFRKTRKADFKLKLPKSLRKIINRQINTKMRKNHLWFWALFLGVSVSLLESLCTGQVYLPMLTIMVKRGSSEALVLLLLYNLMFILPLLAIFAVTLMGVSSRQVTDFFMKHLLLSKVLMTLLFLFLGGYLLILTL